ncbi:MAG: glycosyltransferase family 2 protein, partial [Bacteroidota bacterium]
RLGWCDRVVVLDSYSTDRTLEIASSFDNVDIEQRAFDSFAGQCNHGLTLIDTEWTLSLDSDYVLTPVVIQEIHELADTPTTAGYKAPFQYLVHGKPLRGTLYPPRTVLYRTNRAEYHQDGHAHRVEIDGAVQPLSNVIQHDDRKPLSSWLDAQRRYAAQEAAKLRATPPHELGRNDKLRLSGRLAPILAPIYALIVKGGILDGRAGWTYALQRAYAEILLALHLAEPPPEPPPADTPAASAPARPLPSASTTS